MSVLIAPLPALEDDGLSAGERDPDGLVSNATDHGEAERSHALRLLHTSEDSLTLPILTTAGDVREVVQYLRKKPAGVSVVEALDDVRKRVFEPRKIAAYEFWGIVKRQGDRLQLSQLGWEFARKLAPEAEAYRAVLDQTVPYRAALEWMHEEHHDLITYVQVAAYWQKFYPSGMDHNLKLIESSVVCFFHLCQAAEIGTMTIGKRGQPARLRVERDELAAFVKGRGADSTTHAGLNIAAETGLSSFATSPRAPVETRAATRSEQEHFLILYRRAAPLVSQLQDTLELLDIESRAIVRNETDTLPMSEEMFQAMRQCTAALVVVSPEDFCEDGGGGKTLKQNILIEINSAFVLYDRRVVLIWNCRMPVPGALSSLQHVSLGGDELTWDAGVQLMQFVKMFQMRACGKQRRAG